MSERNSFENVLSKALKGGADFCEIFKEDKKELSIAYEDNKTTNISEAHVYGVGIYIIKDKEAIYLYTNDSYEKNLMNLVEKGLEILDLQSNDKTIKEFKIKNVINPCPVKIYPNTVGHNSKINILKNVYSGTKAISNYVEKLGLTMFDTEQNILVMNSEGVLAEDSRVSSKIRFVPVLTNNMETISYFNDYTRPQGFEAFQGDEPLLHGQRLIKNMESSLFADEAPSGYMPVILEAGGCSGTFFHEACGHQLETGTRFPNSLFKDKLGEKIASKKVNLIDDGSLFGQYGSSKYDDEGMERQKNILIENGILKSFLVDRLGSIKYNLPRSGSGRRQGYSFMPSPRMSNTYLDKGEDNHEEILYSMDKGLFVTEIGGGTGGEEFTLLAQKAYIVEKGEIKNEAKGAILIGRGDETMLKIDKVGDKLVFEDSGSFCGSSSGLIPTTTSGARMRVTGMVVGGKGGSL